MPKTMSNRLTTADVAKITGLCPQTVRHLMRTQLTFGQLVSKGKRKDFYYSVFKIAAWLGTTPEEVERRWRDATEEKERG